MPEDFGIKRIEGYKILQVNSADESLALLKQALTYEHQAAGDIIALNAGAAIYAANLADSLASGVEQAKLVLSTGDALAKLESLAAFTQNVGE